MAGGCARRWWPAGSNTATNCPYCGDTRQRLYFNYEWAVPDPEATTTSTWSNASTRTAWPTRERQQDLLKRVYPLGRERCQAPAPPSAVPPPQPFVPSLPNGILVPVDRLPEAHAASQIPAAAELRPGSPVGDLAGAVLRAVGRRTANPSRRLIIPIYDAEQRLAGWQARYVGECPDSVPKYLSCKGMKKSQLLYGLAGSGSTTGPVVIVEGPTDVWRLGSRCRRPLRQGMSLAQQVLLDQHLPGRQSSSCWTATRRTRLPNLQGRCLTVGAWRC